MQPHFQTNTNQKIKQAVDFLLSETSYYSEVDRLELEKFAAIHLQYGTALILEEGNRIIAVARWNVLPSCDTIHVIDVVIRRDRRNLKMLRRVAFEIYWRNPFTKYFYYDRVKGGKSYGYSVNEWFKLGGRYGR
jgi:hypothetical protein